MGFGVAGFGFRVGSQHRGGVVALVASGSIPVPKEFYKGTLN